MARYSRKATMGTTILGGGVMLLTLALCGCDSNGGPLIAGSTTVGASRTAPVVVFISPGLSGSAAFVAGLPPIFDLRIVASTTVDLDQVTIHMIDGTNLGGPMVTVPRTDLVGQFGSTLIVAGTTRTFTLRPTFVCTNPPRSVAAEIIVRDSRGVSFGVTAVSPCQ
jgi:hypothetical protein